MISRVLSCALLSLAGLLAVAPAHAGPDTLTDSRTTITRGIALNDEGKYKEAIAQFRTVPEGDTNYSWALHELGISYLADSSWNEARETALKTLSLPDHPEPREALLLLANAEDYLGHREASRRTYDSLLSINPYDHQPWYEKGASYLLNNDSIKAMDCFRHAVMVNPGHFRSHLNLGVALMMQGRLSEAYLAISYSLFMTNNGSMARAALERLQAIQNGEDEASKAYNARRPGIADPAFEEADGIVSAKLALSSDYKYESILSGDKTANTMHAILEKVKYDPRDTYFVMQYYLPFFKAAYDRNFDGMLLHMYSGFGMEAVDKLAKKHEREVKDLREDLQAYDSKIVATQVLNYAQRKTAPERYALLPESNTFIVGGIRSADPLKFNPGPVSYYKSGVFGGKGTANAAGEKEGEWTFYYDNGNVHNIEHYHNGVQVGEALYYNRNGILNRAYKFDAEGKVKELREYTYNGLLDALTVEHGDYADYISYHPNGAIDYKAKLVKGKIQDPVVKVAYDDGKPSKEIHYSDGEREGLTREFWPNGKPSEEYNYKNGKREGTGKSWYKNGRLHYTMSYSKGRLDGPYEEYNEDGKLIERGEYANGKKTGTLEYLTPEGRVYGTVDYHRDLAVAYRFTDESGKALSAGDKHSEEGLNLLTAYYADGTRMTELPLSNGQAQGEAKYYYRTGALSKRTRYEGDKREGLETEYYRNGAKRSETMYRADEIYGPAIYYTDAGAKQSEGFLDGGQRVGPWRDYYPDGTVQLERFYINGKVNGPEKNYFANGKLRSIRYLDLNMLVGVVEYDTAGHEFRRQLYPRGEGGYVLNYPSGKAYFTCTLHNGDFDGPYAYYYPNGEVLEQGTMVRDREDGTVTGFHPNGGQSLQGRMAKGGRDGNWKWNDPAQNPDHEISYSEGEQEGLEKVWEGGLLQTDYQYKDGVREGRETLYGDSGHIAAVFFYNEGVISGYTYLGKDGAELPVIPLPHGTGHIVAYYPNGQKSADYTYAGGVATGDGGRWYSNGKPQMEARYDKMGNTQGAFRRWSPNGQLIYEGQYKDDVLRGVEQKWNPAGKLIQRSEYAENGERHGTTTYTNPATGATARVRYYYGAMVEMGK